MEIKMTTTDTPRTDAYQYANYILNHYDPSSHKDKLCLAKSLIEHGYGAAKPKLTRESYDENWNMKQADTPRTDAVQFQKKPISLSIENEMLRALSREIERELTASKAEVERFRSQLERAVEIARGFCGCGCGGDYGLCNFCADQFSELNQLKATLNQTDK